MPSSRIAVSSAKITSIFHSWLSLSAIILDLMQVQQREFHGGLASSDDMHNECHRCLATKDPMRCKDIEDDLFAIPESLSIAHSCSPSGLYGVLLIGWVAAFRKLII